MRYYIDSEFIDDGHSIDLISIGIVAEDGRKYSAQSVEFEPEKASGWVKDNVIHQLDLCPSIWRGVTYSIGTVYGAMIQHEKGKCAHVDCPWRTREQIKQDILAFTDSEKYGEPDFIGWCSGYDFVALCQLFGTMMDVPRTWPHYMHDIQRDLDDFCLTDDMLPVQKGAVHNALADARYICQLWDMIQVERIREAAFKSSTEIQRVLQQLHDTYEQYATAVQDTARSCCDAQSMSQRAATAASWKCRKDTVSAVAHALRITLEQKEDEEDRGLDVHGVEETFVRYAITHPVSTCFWLAESEEAANQAFETIKEALFLMVSPLRTSLKVRQIGLTNGSDIRIRVVGQPVPEWDRGLEIDLLVLPSECLPGDSYRYYLQRVHTGILALATSPLVKSVQLNEVYSEEGQQ